MDKKETKMFYEIGQQPKVLKELEGANKAVLNEIKDEVKKRGIKSFTMVARGSSDNACAYFKYIAEIYCGIPVTLAACGVYTMYDGALDLKDTLVIGVSQSGRAEDVMEVMRRAQKSGSLTVAITNELDSPMAKLADKHFYLNAEKEQSVAATKTFTAQLYALLLIAYYVSGNKKLSEALKKIPEGVAKVIEGADEISKTAEKLKDTKDAFVLARGINYAACLESTLKMQETTYIKAKGYPSSDFQHGPFAMLDENATVLLLIPQGESFKDMSEMLEKVNATGAKTIVYTDTDLKGTLSTVKIPSGSDIETPFYNVVTTQLLVNNLSVIKGNNPDAPRGLKKVTITK